MGLDSDDTSGDEYGTEPGYYADLPSLTIAEADARLPLVQSVIRDIRPLAKDIASRKSRLADLKPLRNLSRRSEDGLHSEEVQQMEEELHADQEQLAGLVAELEAIGAHVADAAAGHVDFRSEVAGERAFLCWADGETEITHWRGLEPDAPRQSLLEGSTSGPAHDADEQNDDE